MSRIIVNANAPKIKIIVEADFRYNPPAISFRCSQTMPALAVQSVLMACAQDLNAMMQSEHAKLQQTEQAKTPNLPPAPQSN